MSKKDSANQTRKIIEDKIRYLENIATDYALRYANSDDASDKVGYQKYKFAAEQLESIRTPVSLGLNTLERMEGVE